MTKVNIIDLWFFLSFIFVLARITSVKNKWSRQDLCDSPGRWIARWWATSGAQPQIVTPFPVHKRTPKRQHPGIFSRSYRVETFFQKNFTFWRDSSSPSPLVRLRWFSLGIDHNGRPRFAYFHPSGGTSQDSPVHCFEKDLYSASAMLNESLPAYTWGPMMTVHPYSDLTSFRLFRILFLTMKSGAGRTSSLFLTEWSGDSSWAELSEGSTHGARREIIGRHPNQVCTYFK